MYSLSVDGEHLKLTKNQLANKIEDYVRKGRCCSVRIVDTTMRLIFHNPVLDVPFKKLPLFLSKLQENIYTLSVSENDYNKTLSKKEFTFRQFRSAIEEFLNDIPEDNEDFTIFVGSPHNA
ncbi:MAG: hypothetical protein KJ569_06360 [Candidatus Omnitrophica bacterium]|nr:hypothetical protein [Candidatus Omnitrophota bacterium]MBU1134516.1 hypothetical protein [Candidatus Omnitrophota bacterium]MBU1810829.1 hypothetical protein [Candidatus Omnitrophota bacterium]